MAKVRISETAEADELEIWTTIALDNLAAADRITDRLYAARAHLAQFPEIGQRRDDLRPGVRHWVIAPYVMLYRIEGDTVEILRVVDGRRELRVLFP